MTLGDYEAPLRISVFVKDIFAGFSMVTLLKAFIAGFDLPSSRNLIKLNLKNDTLRRRFDSLKYDLKKIEEGRSYFICLPQPLPLPQLSMMCHCESWQIRQKKMLESSLERGVV